MLLILFHKSENSLYPGSIYADTAVFYPPWSDQYAFIRREFNARVGCCLVYFIFEENWLMNTEQKSQRRLTFSEIQTRAPYKACIGNTQCTSVLLLPTLLPTSRNSQWQLIRVAKLSRYRLRSVPEENMSLFCRNRYSQSGANVSLNPLKLLIFVLIKISNWRAPLIVYLLALHARGRVVSSRVDLGSLQPESRKVHRGLGLAVGFVANWWYSALKCRRWFNSWSLNASEWVLRFLLHVCTRIVFSLQAS